MKVDIEGGEYNVLDQIIKYQNNLTGLAIEFHNCDLMLEEIRLFIKTFDLDLVHLDGRKLLIKTNPGDITKPILNNPLKKEVNAIDWNIYENKTIKLETKSINS